MVRMGIGFGILSLAALAPAQMIHLTFQSDVGDSIANGHSGDYSYLFPTPGHTLVSEWGPGAPAIEFMGGDSEEEPLPYFTLSVATQMGDGAPALVPGFYSDAHGYSGWVAGKPLLNFTFNHIGGAPLTGDFTVNELSYVNVDGDWLVDVADVSFNQYTIEAGGPGIHGRAIYARTVPEPASLATVGMGLLFIARKRRKAQARTKK